MESQLIWLFILSGTIFGAALIGGAIPFIRPWKEAHLHYFISFGAGVLIGAAFIYMIPEATELISTQIGIAVLSGFLIFYFLERFVMIHPCLEGECEFHHVGWPAFLGFSLHNMVDGVALGASFLVPALTPAVFFALISHHVPTSFAFASSILLNKVNFCNFSMSSSLSPLTTACINPSSVLQINAFVPCFSFAWRV